ncbi:hypothetical protein EV182_002489 [Spiromyces aspiralis]|uniref:Uncharacterized protein n=1 Tax=Spiromyces aspiralis TaxID=68401 RepID=A0ACC1HSE5_9FUNG|nr:hypothetical protein EV182_002489 [Spiromyces aspiralis]
MGDLEMWMDEPFLRQAWRLMGESVLVKMIRDRATGGPANYCFIEFPTVQDASRALVAYNGQLIPNTTKPFRLNWASGNNDRKDERGIEYSVFVGDLSHDVNDYMLLTTFQAQYPSVRSAKVVTDASTGMSRGYGFVRFGDETEQRRAIVEMQGHYCGARPMRISLATPKTRRDTPSDRISDRDRDRNGYNPNTDPHNTTVFVGGLTHPVSENELRAVFMAYGTVVYCKIPPNKGCGFVTFERREDAERAIQNLNGYQISQARIRLSWGRSQNHARLYSSHSMTSSNPQSQQQQAPLGNTIVSTVTTTDASMPTATTEVTTAPPIAASATIHSSMFTPSTPLGFTANPPLPHSHHPLQQQQQQGTLSGTGGGFLGSIQPITRASLPGIIGQSTHPPSRAPIVNASSAFSNDIATSLATGIHSHQQQQQQLHVGQYSVKSYPDPLGMPRLSMSSLTLSNDDDIWSSLSTNKNFSASSASSTNLRRSIFSDSRTSVDRLDWEAPTSGLGTISVL